MNINIASATATLHLFDKISEDLSKYKVGIKLDKFSDEEMSPQFLASIRDKKLFLFGATSKPEDFMELLLIISAAKRSCCGFLTVILPYYGYGRQDKKEGHRGTLGASMIANILMNLGVNRVLSIDLHAEQIQGFFSDSVPLEHIKGHSIFLDKIKEIVYEIGADNLILCAPDSGGVHRVEKYSEKLDISMVSIFKKRDKPNSISSMVLIGDVRDKNVILFDDMADTCGTLKKSVKLLKEKGAKKVIFVATHPVLSGEALLNLRQSNLDVLILSDTIEQGDFLNELEHLIDNGKLDLVLHKISCINVLERVIKNLTNSKSISEINS